MYHITITDGYRTVEDVESEGYILAANMKVGDKEGVMCASSIGEDVERALSLIFAMDEIRNRAFAENPILAVCHAMKDSIIESEESIELTGLKNLLYCMTEDEDEYEDEDE